MLLSPLVRTVLFILHGISCMTFRCYAVICHVRLNVHRSTCHGSSYVHTPCLVLISNRYLCPVLHFMAMVHALTRSFFRRTCSRGRSVVRHAVSQWLRLIRSFVHFDPSVSCSPESSDMSAEEAMVGSTSGAPQAASAASPAAAKASPQSKKASRPKIDLDDEIRRANDLAAMSRKMLQAAKNVSRNNRKAKQRLIKKAGKLSPEDLERIPGGGRAFCVYRGKMT